MEGRSQGSLSRGPGNGLGRRFPAGTLFIVRIIHRQSPFKADKNHIHHALIRLGLSHSKASLTLGGTQVAFIGLVVLLKDFNDNYVLAGIIVLAVILSLTLDHLVQKKSGKQSAV